VAAGAYGSILRISEYWDLSVTDFAGAVRLFCVGCWQILHSDSTGVDVIKEALGMDPCTRFLDVAVLPSVAVEAMGSKDAEILTASRIRERRAFPCSAAANSASVTKD
jgi:hypothetical protein